MQEMMGAFVVLVAKQSRSTAAIEIQNTVKHKSIYGAVE